MHSYILPARQSACMYSRRCTQYNISTVRRTYSSRAGTLIPDRAGICIVHYSRNTVRYALYVEYDTSSAYCRKLLPLTDAAVYNSTYFKISWQACNGQFVPRGALRYDSSPTIPIYSCGAVRGALSMVKLSEDPARHAHLSENIVSCFSASDQPKSAAGGAVDFTQFADVMACQVRIIYTEALCTLKLHLATPSTLDGILSLSGLQGCAWSILWFTSGVRCADPDTGRMRRPGKASVP